MIKDIINANENVKPNSREMAVLKETFPSCFNVDGSFDLERFKEFLSDRVSVTSEGYELKFLGKNYARLLASVDTTTVVVPNEEHNLKPENAESENIYISGDNLDGLKHLLKSYSGKVKCIYIDPPYNTGTDGFVYNDSFNFTVDELSEKLSISEEQAQRILDLTKRGSASHSAWLMFMYPRLILARDMMADDGAIFISIDENEQANLKLICDDAFGEENFIADLVWVKKTGASDATHIATVSESILVYAKKKNMLAINHNYESYDIGRYNQKDEYYNTRGPYYTDNLDRGTLGYHESLDYNISDNTGRGTFPNGRKHQLDDGWRWKWSKDKVKWGIENGFIQIQESSNKDSGVGVYYKIYLNVDNEGNPIDRSSPFKNIIQGILNTHAANEAKEIFGNSSYFSNPKPIGLIEWILQLLNSDGIILDFFAGSCTTAHAVMKNNVLNSMQRKFILIQLPENLDDKLAKSTSTEKSDIQKTINFLDSIKRPHTLDQIGMARIIRAAKAIKEEYPDTTADLGFKHFTLAEPSKNTLDKLEKFDPNDIKMFADKTLLDDFGKPTILATWIVRDGYGLTANAEELDFAGYKGYYIDKHLYLIDPEMPNEAIEEMVVKYETDGGFNPENIVLFGYSFTWTQIEALQVNLKRLKDTEKNLSINFDIRY